MQGCVIASPSGGPQRGGRLNVVEQQLLAALRETPAETDCSVSTHVLVSLDIVTSAEQEQWLSLHRSPRDGKRWFQVGDRWEYCRVPEVHWTERLAAAADSEASQAAARLRAIVVKPVSPLERRR